MNVLLFHYAIDRDFERDLLRYFSCYYSYVHSEEENRLITYLVFEFPNKVEMMRYQMEYSHHLASSKVQDRYKRDLAQNREEMDIQAFLS